MVLHRSRVPRSRLKTLITSTLDTKPSGGWAKGWIAKSAEKLMTAEARLEYVTQKMNQVSNLVSRVYCLLLMVWSLEQLTQKVNQVSVFSIEGLFFMV